MKSGFLVILSRSNHTPVMPGLVPGIHVFRRGGSKTWMAGTSPAMTVVVGGVR
jgi:hypothetical protein